jgi:3-hydroxyisobutyrate dehydrogenase-like beta-hydroxyacid dehydrogenase/alkylhydroperoxidase/carboxymuconolactone decarboxylase family protein YurZ
VTVISQQSKQRCGVIGMGMIGAGVAECLVRKSRRVFAYDVRPAAAAAVAGVHACASPAEVARNSDVLIVSVVSAEQAHSVLFGAQGVAEGAHPNLIVALMCTIRVPLVLKLASEAQRKSFKLIDVAITTGGAPTSAGTAGLMAGGDVETVEATRGVMEEFSSLFAHMGPVGAGMAAKVARNIMHYCAALGAYEGGLLAEAAGVDVAKLIEVVRKSDPHNVMSTKLLERRGVKPLGDQPREVLEKFEGWAGLLYKDLDAGIDLARSLGVEVPGAQLAQERGDLIYGLPQGTTAHVSPVSLTSDARTATDAGADASASADGTAGAGPGATTGEHAAAAELRALGVRTMDAVYGKGMVKTPAPEAQLQPFLDATVRILFGEVWNRPGLSMRDRRLLVIGATAQLNRPDLIEIQSLGALINGELTEDQLQEAVLHLAFYCGWPNATSVSKGFGAAIKKAAELKATQQKP